MRGASRKGNRQMYEASLLPKRTISPVARRLHALLRYCPGYSEAIDSPRRVGWVLTSILQLRQSDLPIGCVAAAAELQAVLPQFAPKLTRHLTIEQVCK